MWDAVADMLLPVLGLLLDGLDPDGDGGSPRARYSGGGNRGSWARKVRADGRVTMFWGLAGSTCCMYYGGVEPKVVQRRAAQVGEGQQGGARWEGQEGRVVTMLAAGRNCCVWRV